MTKIYNLREILAVFAVMIFVVPAPAMAQDCDRECLRSLVTTYVDALVAKDPARLPLAEGARYTVNSNDANLGEGLWQSITGKGVFRHDYLDTTAQVAATHVDLLEGEDHVLYSVVLHVTDGRIAGIEALEQRITPESMFQPTELGHALPNMDDIVPVGERRTRSELIDIALTYTNGLRIGSFADAGIPFGEDTYRVENGVITAGVGCAFPDCGLTTQRIMVHPGIIPSLAAVDEETGTVLLWMNFGFTDSYGPGNALVTFEAFKIRSGQIVAINAFFATIDMATPRQWPTLDRITAQQ